MVYAFFLLVSNDEMADADQPKQVILHEVYKKVHNVFRLHLTSEIFWLDAGVFSWFEEFFQGEAGVVNNVI